MNHPVLKKLVFNAPGTYQHSVVVGNLAESGALKIEANPLLARVASYFHDIGKGKQAFYFIENQPPNSQNIHDGMDPYDSVKAIINHLKFGLEMAEKHRLGTAIKDILVQHHGTSIVKLFYEKAQRLADDSVDSQKVDEKLFRYPGPKPQTKEAALVMLADITEASTRSIVKPTKESVTRLINKVAWGLLESGQLDESGITMRDFRTVVDEYCKVMISIHHHRLQYPGN